MLTFKWRLRTATKDAAAVHSEINLTSRTGNTKIKYRVLVVDIERDDILGDYIISNRGFQLDLNRRTLNVGPEIV